MSQREPMDAAEICVGRGAPMLKAADPQKMREDAMRSDMLMEGLEGFGTLLRY